VNAPFDLFAKNGLKIAGKWTIFKFFEACSCGCDRDRKTIMANFSKFFYYVIFLDLAMPLVCGQSGPISTKFFSPTEGYPFGSDFEFASPGFGADLRTSKNSSLECMLFLNFEIPFFDDMSVILSHWSVPSRLSHFFQIDWTLNRRQIASFSAVFSRKKAIKTAKKCVCVLAVYQK
jgi:hypothetical protein